MMLKCFGGPLDQQKQSIHNDRIRQNEIFRFPNTTKLSVRDFNPNTPPEITTLTYHFYVVEIVSVKTERFKFLRYNEISIEDTFAKIFT